MYSLHRKNSREEVACEDKEMLIWMMTMGETCHGHQVRWVLTQHGMWKQDYQYEPTFACVDPLLQVTHTDQSCRNAVAVIQS